MLSLVELRRRYLSGLTPDQTVSVEYYSALMELIFGQPAGESALLKQLIGILEIQESALPVSDICAIIRHLGQHSTLDASIFELLEFRPDTSRQIPECIHDDIDSLTDRSCAVWCRFLLDQGYRPEYEGIVRPLLERVSSDEELKVLQLALSALYSAEGAPDTCMTSRNCIGRITGESKYGIALGIEAAKILYDGGIHLSKHEADDLARFVRKVEETTGSPVKEQIKAFRCFHEQLAFLKSKGLLIVQFLYYGDPDHSGSGTSGGLATIVRDLGTALSVLPGIAGVITVTVYNTAETVYPYEAIRFIDENHVILRMPLYLGNASPGRFVQLRGEIEREVAGITRKLITYGHDVKPLYHVRYLDSAALASCKAAKQVDIPTVITLTPDPHRSLDRRNEQPHRRSVDEVLKYFERIVTGDRLVEMADGIIGIGRRSVTTSLLPYFPQLADMQDKQLTGIDEGIQVGCRYPPVDIRRLLLNDDSPLHIDEASINRPLIVNIGRLHPAKGQISLLRAWNEYGLWRHHNLLIIGGNFLSPNEYERETIEFFIPYVMRNPELRGKVALHPALPNRTVRSLHSHLAQREIVNLPDIYVCSSLKEEFGLSIIEAMSAGMIVLAPLRGGAVEYIRHGINGFLIDTGSADALGREIGTCIGRNFVSPERIRAIQLNAKNTVERKYSLEKIAGDFLDFYNTVLEEMGRKV